MFYLKVLHGVEHVGWATGVTYSPTLKRMISLVRLRKDLAVPDTDLSVVWGGFSDEPVQLIRARVQGLPFIRQHRRDELAGKVEGTQAI
jgi:glycine cleavage system aminomethyltransferase T